MDVKHGFYVQSGHTFPKAYEAQMHYANPHNIMKWRSEEGLTQAQCARLMGVNIRTWQRYESGERRLMRLTFHALRVLRKSRGQIPVE